MTQQQEDKLKEMLASKNEADINLAGSIINKLPQKEKLNWVAILTPKYGDEVVDILNSEYISGLTEKKINKYLTEIYGQRQTPSQQTIMVGSRTYQMFEQELENQYKIHLETNRAGLTIKYHKTNEHPDSGHNLWFGVGNTTERTIENLSKATIEFLNG